jgi:hypothetical protein
MNESAEYTETIRAEFPILSQTSTHDKRVLLNLREILQVNPSYSYLEIGSYLGGSLTPFLSDPKCTAILSIDDRGRVQPDERGRTFDYSHITHETMISTLEDHGLSVEKLKVFDGSISDYADADAKYDLLFIDGEHTDWACFRDFVYGIRLAKDDAIVAFHDSTLVWKALMIIQEYLTSTGMRYVFHKAVDSEVSCLLLGRYESIDVGQYFEVVDDLDEFYVSSELFLFNKNIKNRLDTSALANQLRIRVSRDLRRRFRRARRRLRQRVQRPFAPSRPPSS